MIRRSLPLALALLPTALCAQAPPSGVSFTHHDWELACDNTRTCRGGDSALEQMPAEFRLTMSLDGRDLVLVSASCWSAAYKMGDGLRHCVNFKDTPPLEAKIQEYSRRGNAPPLT